MITKFIQRSWSILLDILFPPQCLHCEQTLINADSNADKRGFNKILCGGCYSSIKINTTLFCAICRARLPENKKICHENAPCLLAAASNYSDPALQNLIHYFKYKPLKSIAPILAEILIKYLQPMAYDLRLKAYGFTVVPVPLHPSRERERGFNQAELLGRIIAKHYNLPFEPNLKKIKNNKPQVGLDMEARKKNVSGCFQIKNPEAVRGKNILLIDDVFTSGATMNEAALVLKRAGAKKIIALVAAKA